MTEATDATPTPNNEAAGGTPEGAEQLLTGGGNKEGTPEAGAKPAEGDKAGAKPAEGENKDGPAKPDAKGDGKGKVDGAPEKYEPFVVPEGIQRDDAKLDKFGALAKEANLTQETAQKFVDFYAEVTQEYADTSWQNWADVTNGWAQEVKADKEFGGQNLDDSKAAASAFVKKFIGDEGLKALQMTGAGNHPAIFKGLARAGKLLAEDVIAVGANSGGGPVDRAKRLFPNQN